MLLSKMAKNCSIGPRKCFLSTRGGLVLDVVTAAARSHPESLSNTVRTLVYTFVNGAGEGGWRLG